MYFMCRNVYDTVPRPPPTLAIVHAYAPLCSILIVLMTRVHIYSIDIMSVLSVTFDSLREFYTQPQGYWITLVPYI